MHKSTAYTGKIEIIKSKGLAKNFVIGIEMSSFIIKPSKLQGTIYASGAKNAALSILAASLLSEDEIAIENVPSISDVHLQMEILRLMGAKLKVSNNKVVCVDPSGVAECEIPNNLTKLSRGSILFLGSLLAKFHRVKMGLPGGDAIGARPIDLHLRGLAAMGASIKIGKNSVEVTAKRLKGARIFLDRPSTTATENIIMAATLAEGITVIENAEKVPEIIDLVRFLRSMGAKIRGEETGIIKIKGVSKLGPTTHKLIPDPFEAGTFMVASAITKGDVLVANAISSHLIPTIAKLREAGAKVEIGNRGICVKCKEIKSINIFTSAPYPAFQSDMQPIFAALLTVAKGASKITDSVFPQRFRYANELKKMGAHINICSNSAVIKGVKKIVGAHVKAEDIRGGACLILAALVAENESFVENAQYVDRGYENIEKKMQVLGAEIKRARFKNDI